MKTALILFLLGILVSCASYRDVEPKEEESLPHQLPSRF
jgi:hypothetical protein